MVVNLDQSTHVWSPPGIRSGPPFFVLYLAEVFAVVKQFGFLVLGYADDLQLYDHAAPSASMSLVSRLSDCVEAVKALWPLADCVLIPLRLSSSGLVPPGTFSSARLAH